MICLPVFFLLVIVGIQFALWSHAAHLARAAAEQGSQVASGYGSSAQCGHPGRLPVHRHHRPGHAHGRSGLDHDTLW